MASVQRTIQVEGVVTGIRLDPVAMRVLVDGIVRQVGSNGAMASYTEDVTSLLSPADAAAALALVASAQVWIDSKR